MTLEIREHTPRRDRGDIIAQILFEAKNGISKTKLVYRCNLNFNLIEKYLGFLMKRSMLTADKNGSFALYRTTRDGLYALDAIKIAEKVISLKTAERESMDEHWGAQDWFSGQSGQTHFWLGDSTVLVPFKLIRGMCDHYKESMCQYEKPGRICEASTCALLRMPMPELIGLGNRAKSIDSAEAFIAISASEELTDLQDRNDARESSIPDYEHGIIECVDSVLGEYGDGVKFAIYARLLKLSNADRRLFVRNPELLLNALKDLFGVSASGIEEKIITVIRKRFQLAVTEDQKDLCAIIRAVRAPPSSGLAQ